MELKRCNCGHNASIHEMSDSWNYHCRSHTCGMSGPAWDTPKGAAEAWNAMQDEILAGQTVLSRIPDGSVMMSVQLAHDTNKPGAGWLMIDFEPTPTPAPTKSDVLRICKEQIVRFCGPQKRWEYIVGQIDAALAAEE